MNETVKSLLNRRSIRAFKPEQIPQTALNDILEAGKFAASANNRQPWHFTVVQNKELLDEIVEEVRQAILSTGDAQAAERAASPSFHTFYHAPTVVIVSGDESNSFAESDSSNTVQNMAVAAHALGLGSCIIASFRMAFGGPKAEALVKKLGIPAGYRPLFSLALGYKACEDPEAPPRKENSVNFVG